MSTAREDSDTPSISTRIPDLRSVPLRSMAMDKASDMDQTLRRVVPRADTVKAPVAAFDASL